MASINYLSRGVQIFCMIFPFPGFLIAIIAWLAKGEELADKLLFASFVGIFVNIIILLPLFLVLRAVFSS